MKRLFSLSSTKSTGSSSDRRSRTFSDKKSGSVMRPNVVSLQQSTGGPQNNEDGLVWSRKMIAKNRSNEGMENVQNKEGIADGDNDEVLFDSPQQSAVDQPNIERELVPPQESSSDNNKEKKLSLRQESSESSADQQTDEDQQNSEETSICPQHRIAGRQDNQKESFLLRPKSSDDHQTEGDIFDPTRQSTVEQHNKETSGGPQQSNEEQGIDGNDFAGQQDNQDDSVPPSNAAQRDNEGKVRSQSTTNEHKNKNKFFPQEEQQHQQDNEENLPSHCQNKPDQLQQANEESLVSSQPTNHCIGQRKDRNDTIVTRF